MPASAHLRGRANRKPASSAPVRIPRARFIDDYLPYLLAQSSAIACAGFDERIRRAGLAGQAWRVLATLADGDGMTIGQLSRFILMQQPRATQVITQLEEEELVERRQSSKDRRQTLVFITPSGRQRISSLLSAADRDEKSVFSVYSAAEIAQLKRLLRRLVKRSLVPDSG